MWQPESFFPRKDAVSMANANTPQQALHRAYCEAPGKVHLVSLDLWLRRSAGLVTPLNGADDLLKLTDAQADEALRVLSNCTESASVAPKALVLSSLREAHSHSRQT
jgi:hypothetical protein